MSRIWSLVEDAELWDRASRGDEHAFQELYHRYWKLLLAEAYRSLQNREDAEDVVQNLFIDVYGRMSQVTVLDVRAYLLGAVRNGVFQRIRQYIKDRTRHNKLTELNLVEPEDRSFLENGDYLELERILEAAIEQLPDKCKEVFLLSREQQLSYHEIAVRLTISERTVEKHISKALKLLRSSLSGIYGNYLFCLIMFGGKNPF